MHIYIYLQKTLFFANEGKEWPIQHMLDVIPTLMESS